jgi:hypothetical protein
VKRTITLSFDSVSGSLEPSVVSGFAGLSNDAFHGMVCIALPRLQITLFQGAHMFCDAREVEPLFHPSNRTRTHCAATAIALVGLPVCAFEMPASAELRDTPHKI